MDARSVEDAARRFFDALENGDWPAAVSAVAPAALEAQARAWRRPISAASGDLPLGTTRTPDLERRLVSAERYNEMVGGPDGWWRGTFPDLESVEALLSAPPGLLAAMHLERTLSPERIGVVGIRWRVLGALLDGEDEACVVFRVETGPYLTPEGATVEPLRIPTLLLFSWHHGDGWLISGFPQRDAELGVTGWRRVP